LEDSESFLVEYVGGWGLTSAEAKSWRRQNRVNREDDGIEVKEPPIQPRFSNNSHKYLEYDDLDNNNPSTPSISLSNLLEEILRI